jgi:hypothetical protein
MGNQGDVHTNIATASGHDDEGEPVSDWDDETVIVTCVDADFDGVCDLYDNCINTPNPDQADVDQDDIGDACDPIRDVMVDIKPGSDLNPLNVQSRGKLPMAILGSATFDVNMVDPSTVLLNWDGLTPVDGMDAAPPERWAWEDVDGDGFMDVTFKFNMNVLRPFTVTHEEPGELVMRLAGVLSDGTQIAGEDALHVINNKSAS